MHKVCVVDGVGFEAKRAAAKYCSERCKKRAQRKPPADAVDLAARRRAAAGGDGALLAATRQGLAKVGREDTPLGTAALSIAERIDMVGLSDTGGGMAALMREYRATLAEAVKDADQIDDALEQIRGSAALKLIAGGRRGA
jgi:hypothetical protein